MIKHILLIATASLYSLSAANAASAADIRVNINGLKGADGSVFITLCTPQTWEKWTQCQSKLAQNSGGTASVMYTDIAPGSYGITVFHDENGNGKLDFGKWGKPSEGTGASNNPRPPFRGPNFREAKFDVGTDDVSMTINIRH